MFITFHEKFITNIVEKIQIQLKFIQNKSTKFANEIKFEKSTLIKFTNEKYDKHDFDAQFRHSKIQFSEIVIEMSYSQKKNIERFANDYIFEFDNDIRMIVNLNIEYKIDKKTTLFVWRSNIITNEIEKKKLIVQLIVANQICKHHLNLYFMLIRCKFFVISMTIQIHFVQKIFDYVFEISSRKFWSKLIYAIRLSFLSTNYIRFLKTRKMQRSSLNNNLTSSQLINRE